MLKSHVITDLEQFKGLKDEWNQLLQTSFTNTFFMTWEWVYTWWEVFGKNAKLFIITVRNEKEELVGIAPLYIKISRYYKFPVKEMAFIGMGLSDRQDFIVFQGDTRIIGAIIEKFYESTEAWDIVHLEEVPADSPLVQKEIARKFRPSIECSSLSPFVNVEADWELYFKSLNRDFRHEMGKKRRSLNKLGDWEYRVDRKVEDVKALMHSIQGIEKKSRKIETAQALFLSPENRDFFYKTCNFCVEKNWLDFSSLRIGDKLVAYTLGFIYGETYYGYNTAYDKEFIKLSPGKVVMNEKLKWFFENKDIIKVFDFSRGNSQVKSEWTSTGRQHVRVVFFNWSFYSKVIRLAVFHVRPVIKKFIKMNRTL